MRLRTPFLTVFIVAGLVSFVRARVVRVEITSRADVLAAQPFGAVGPYERITGRVYFAVLLANNHNRRIVDLDKAMNLKNGEVDFWSDFFLVRPKDIRRGNGTMLLEIPNRGRSRIISLVDGGSWDLSSSAGDGGCLPRASRWHRWAGSGTPPGRIRCT